MKRELLFRGKGDPKYNDGEWYEGYLIHDTEDFQIVDYVSERSSVSRTVIDETVGQYTVRKDVNGTKIFEEDIVRSISTGKVAVVQWFGEYCAFMLWCKGDNSVYWFYDNDFDDLEVIGNIHDNPELL